MTEEIETNPKSLKLKVDDRFRITKYRNIFSRAYTKNWSKDEFVIDSVLKTNPWMYKLKGLNGETIIESFNEKELLLSKLSRTRQFY